MLISKGSREDAIHALINVWLKDNRQYCAWCDEDFNPEFYPCCEQPFIGDNARIMKQFNKELQLDREEARNKFASNADNSMRLTLKFPPRLLKFLETSFESMYGEKLFTKEYNINWFAKKFHKYFAVAKEI